MSLREYRRKRDFTRTSEPKGRERPTDRHRFVVQKHAARRLHYDLRLELHGVLKSWAVTRGPSLVAGEKRLAVQTEDHPLQYIDFEGPIPDGEYGAGRMIVWDTGTWSTDGDAEAQLAKGHLTFELAGQKLGGRWHLVRLPSDRGRDSRSTRASAKTNWLLMKSDDERAVKPGRDVLSELPKSVKSGLTIEEIDPPPAAGAKPPVAASSPAPGTTRVRPERRKLPKEARPEPLPDFIPPALATPAETPPTGSRWLHEIKFDGYRLIARIDHGRVKIKTRSGLDWTTKFKSIADDLARLAVTAALIDSELVVEGEDGISSFSDLQADLAAGRQDRLVLYAFDLLHLDGKDIRRARLDDRRALLRQVLAEAGPNVRFSESFEEDGAVILKHACRLGLEGVVSKRHDAPYTSGRGKTWIKSKCIASDEFIVSGYTPSTVARRSIGALVLARRTPSGLGYAGRVGTGFSAATAEALWHRLSAQPARTPPPLEGLTPEARRGVRWVEPTLVAAVEFRALTGDGLLRHASYKGLRDDKRADELAVSAVAAATPREDEMTTRLTHADRPLWPDDGVTKAGLADYLTSIWPWIAPYVLDRPLALVRCPGGITEACFFQKHRFAGMTDDIRVTTDSEDGKDILSVASHDGLVALAQASVCEIHTWGSRLADIERPDMITFELDPSEDTGWEAVLEGAHDVRDRLAATGLTSFVKTSGGKGLHVVAPLKPAADWDAVKSFCERIARQMASEQPDRYVAVMSKEARRGRIFVDYLRNGRGATTVCAYSPRARAGAPVSMPLAWDELSTALRPNRYTIDNAAHRLDNLGSDPWAGFFDAAERLYGTRTEHRPRRPVVAKPRKPRSRR
jgi:bifunctional non-homologous end joining protein LigD